MARSFDNRKHPGGPYAGPDANRRTMRGNRREVYGRVTPGDDIEVTREIERLWEWHNRLWRENSFLRKELERLTGRLEPDYPRPWDEIVGSPDLTGGSAATGYVQMTAPGPSFNFADMEAADAGPYRDNYESGYRLQVCVKALDCSDCDLLRVSVGGLGTFDLPLPTWSGGGFSGIYNGPWTNCSLVDSSGVYGDRKNISLAASTALGLSNGECDDGYLWWRWVAVDSDAYRGGMTLPAGDANNDAARWDDATQTWIVDDELNANARVGVRANGGTTYKRRRVNVIPGSTKLSAAAADDSVNEEVDVTLDVVPAEIDVTDLGGYSGSGLLALSDDGTFRNFGGRFNAVLYGIPSLGTTRYVAVPRGAADADIALDLERLHLRTETPSSSGDVVAKLQKSTGGSAPSWTDIGTITLPAGDYEVDMTIGAYSVTSDDLLRLYFTSIGTAVTDYQALITGARTA